MINPLDYVSRETLSKIQIFQEELFQWNRIHNLIQKKTESIFFERHILDVLEFLESLKPYEGARILDVGSGAGIPGIVLSICSIPYVTLNEINPKKVAFLYHIKQTLNLACEIESRPLQLLETSYDIYISRAFASISHFLDLVKTPQQGTKVFFLKGPLCISELQEARQRWSFDEEVTKGRFRECNFMVCLKNIQKKKEEI